MLEQHPRRFAIRFDRAYRLVSSALRIPPSDSYVEVDEDRVHVRMAWAFRARFGRSVVTSVASVKRKPLSRGVHGFRGRWLVNGSGRGILLINLEPAQPAYVVGFSVRLQQLLVSVDDPSELATALGH